MGKVCGAEPLKQAIHLFVHLQEVRLRDYPDEHHPLVAGKVVDAVQVQIKGREGAREGLNGQVEPAGTIRQHGHTHMRRDAELGAARPAGHFRQG